MNRKRKKFKDLLECETKEQRSYRRKRAMLRNTYEKEFVAELDAEMEVWV